MCAMHDRRGVSLASKKSIADMYACQFTQEIKEFGSAGFKNLAAEVGILRVVLKSMISNCSSPNELVMNAGPISDLTSKLGNLVAQIDRIDMNSGNLLTEEDIVQIANEIVYAISQRITDAAVLKLLAADINRIIMAKFDTESPADKVDLDDV